VRADERASTFPRLGARRSARVEFGGPSDKIVSLVRGHGERLRDSEPSAPKRRVSDNAHQQVPSETRHGLGVKRSRLMATTEETAD
jgi:hypothetical protein